jgi:hypothetical protein
LKKRSKKLLIPVGVCGANPEDPESKKFLPRFFQKAHACFFIAHPRPLALRRIDAH